MVFLQIVLLEPYLPLKPNGTSSSQLKTNRVNSHQAKLHYQLNYSNYTKAH